MKQNLLLEAQIRTKRKLFNLNLQDLQYNENDIQSQSQIQESKNKDKFQLQFLMTSPTSIPKSKNQFKDFWDQAKNDQKKSSSFCNFVLPIRFNDDSNLATLNSEPFSPGRGQLFQSMNGSSNSSFKKTYTFNNQQTNSKNDDQLSKQFQNLKQKQQKLLAERQSIFKQPPTKSKTVLIGNYLKLRVFVQEK